MAAPTINQAQAGIIAIMEGTHVQADAADIRVTVDGDFVYGALDGEDRANQAKALIAGTDDAIFDVLFGDMTTHESSPLSRKSNHKILRVAVSIPVYKRTRTQAQESERKTAREDLAQDMDTAIQSLAYPGNLTQNGAASPSATNIIGGCLMGPDGTGDPIRVGPTEDWDQQMIVASIEASALMKVTQETSPSA